MAEDRFVQQYSGQEIREQDLANMSDNAGFADDRVLWELVRLQPGTSTPQKVILPYGVSGWGKPGSITSTALVSGNQNDGRIRIAPFRAIVGSTTAFGSSAIENLRGIRSGYLLGLATLHTVVALAANASGNPRWDLVYAVVTPESNGPTITVKKKDPTTGVVANAAVVITKNTPVTVAVQQGTPAGSPTYPALPADGAGNYYIPLAYILVPNGFGASSPVNRESIYEVAPCAPILSSLGVPNIAPASQAWKVGGTVDVHQNGSTSTFRPGAYLPATMVGGEERIIPLQLGLSPASHADVDVVDDSVDWRFRMFQWAAMVIGGSTQAAGFVWDRHGSGGQQTPSAPLALGMGSVAQGWGQSCFDDSTTFSSGVTFSTSPFTSCKGIAVYVDDVVAPQLGSAATAIALYVDSATGVLKLRKSSSGAVSAQLVIWLRATGPFSNFGVLP